MIILSLCLCLCLCLCIVNRFIQRKGKYNVVESVMMEFMLLFVAIMAYIFFLYCQCMSLLNSQNSMHLQTP